MAKRSNAVRKDEIAPVETNVEVSDLSVSSNAINPPAESHVAETAEVADKQPAETVTEQLPATADLIKQYGNKSGAIRALNAKGHSRSEIAKALGIRYQHVNNVLHQPLKREIKKQRDEAKQTEQTAAAETK